MKKEKISNGQKKYRNRSQQKIQKQIQAKNAKTNLDKKIPKKKKNKRECTVT